MPHLIVSGSSREIDIVVFDKDGTLIDFGKAWGGRLKRGIRAVCAGVGGDAGLEAALYHTLGAEPASGTILTDGPYVSATIAETCTIAASVLYQSGTSWHRSVDVVDRLMRPVFTAPPLPEEIGPIGDVARRFALLRSAGLRLAVVTNDERAGTLAGLDVLGIAHLIDAVVCADDAGLAPKPAADGILHIARLLGAAPHRLAMVGDAVGDLRAGRAAGAGLTVGVLSGPATADELTPHADVIAVDIHALETAENQALARSP